MATHRYILSAGHHNKNRGGAEREFSWTYDQCVIIRDAIVRRGGQAWIIQEEDGDNDPTDSIGRDLQNVARLCVDLARAVGGVDAYLSVHYEGVENTAIRGFFGIFPDDPTGASVDVRANNPLDYRLCQVLATHVAKTGMPKRTGWVVEPGVMSERQTGVGGKGYRLGEFAGTVGFRDTTARVIIEGGAYTNTADRALLWNAEWRRQYAEALVDGLEEVFGTFTESKPAPVPEPTPTPQPTYESPSPIKELQGERPLVLLSNGAVLTRLDAVVEATRDTPRLKYAGGAARVGPDIPAGERFLTDYLIVLENGELYVYTPWATRVRWSDIKVIGEEV